jgi:hypothetical protein
MTKQVCKDKRDMWSVEKATYDILMIADMNVTGYTFVRRLHAGATAKTNENETCAKRT